METHGPRFDLSANHFSVDQKQDKSFKRDFYDDAILNFDNKVKEVANFLKQKNLFDNTILVITTDHGTRWSSNKRLPLIIKFPYSRHSGLTSGNTQRADIPPTILDYLGAEIPQWMDGDSLISGNIDKKRVIYSATSAENHMDENGDWRIIDYSPPFYALGKLAIIQCQQWIQLDLISKKLETSEIENHTSPCVAEDLLSQEQAYELIVEHLMDADYDMSGFTKKEVLFGQ